MASSWIAGQANLSDVYFLVLVRRSRAARRFAVYQASLAGFVSRAVLLLINPREFRAKEELSISEIPSARFFDTRQIGTRVLA